MQQQAQTRCHFIGIGGIGMSALAIFCHQKGYKVSGSDLSQSFITDKLKQMGMTIYTGHNKAYTHDAQLVIYSSAVTKDNPEYQQAISKGTQVFQRAEFLAELSKDFPQTIAITGTHGKTTVTALLSHILQQSGLNPSYVIGGIAHDLTHHARYTPSPYLIIEADESDASFLNFSPKHIIITNVDQDHMQTYDHDDEKLKQSFITFIEKTTGTNNAILIGCDHFGGQSVKQNCPKGLSYGFASHSDIRITQYQQQPDKIVFDIQYLNQQLTGFEFSMIGQANLENALAAVALCIHLGIDIAKIKRALATFRGIFRRFDYYKVTYANKSIDLIDDYGHHPIEIQGVLTAINKHFPSQRLIHVYQPHRYTRTRDLFDDFVNILKLAPIVIIVESYAACEALIEGATAKDLYHQLKKYRDNCFYVNQVEKVTDQLDSIVDNDDVVLVQGAGNIGEVVKNLI